MPGALLWLLLFLLVLPVGRALVRYLETAAERKALPPAPVSAEEHREVREELRLLSERVDKLREDTDFLTRLLEERPPRRAIANRGNDDR